MITATCAAALACNQTSPSCSLTVVRGLYGDDESERSHKLSIWKTVPW